MAYRVDIPHHYEVLYSEDGRVLRIETDLRDYTPVIYRRTIKSWDPPHDSVVISEEKKDEILRRVYDFMVRVRGFPRFEIDRSP
jgi:hypothetical protein